MIKYKRYIAIAILVSTLALITPQQTANAQFGWVGSIFNGIRSALAAINAMRAAGRGIPGVVPHLFPFGGRITSSDDGCSLRFWVWFTGFFGIPIPCPNCGWIPLGSTAIQVGPPVASPGEMFTLLLISDIYRNHAEDRVGPWALGIGFTPFPIDQINSAMGAIRIPYGAGWLDHFHLSCPQGSDGYYKVIRKLGTSPR